MKRILVRSSRPSLGFVALLAIAGCGGGGMDDGVDPTPELHVTVSPSTPGNPNLELTTDTPLGTIELSDRGTAALTLGLGALVDRSDDNGTALHIHEDECSNRTLGSGQSCAVTLQATSRDCGQAVFQISSNDPTLPILRVTVQYRGSNC